MVELVSVESHIRPVESMSIVAVSLPGRASAVAVGRVVQGLYVLFPATYSIETSSDDGPWRRTWATSPTTFTSAWAFVLLEIRSTFVHVLSGSRRHTHVPAGSTVVDGITAHQLPPCFQTLDCGFSPVLAEIGMFGTSCRSAGRCAPKPCRHR